jgi:enoyl-CoA hydratase
MTGLTTQYDTLLVERDLEHGVLELTLNRPAVLNAISTHMRHELLEAFKVAEADSETRVVLLRGAGRAFSAGDDLKEAFDHPPREHTVRSRRDGIALEIEVCMRVWDFPKPVIAAVHGYCLGAGCDLSLACDVTIAADNLRIGEPEIRHVSSPPTLLMPWVIGVKKAKYLLLTGNTIDAVEAERIGLVSVVVPEAELDQRARELAAQMAQIPADTLMLNKIALNRCLEIAGLREGVQYSLETGTLIQLTKSVEELERRQKLVQEAGGLQAFLAGRDGHFEAGNETATEAPR